MPGTRKAGSRSAVCGLSPEGHPHCSVSYPGIPAKARPGHPQGLSHRGPGAHPARPWLCQLLALGSGLNVASKDVHREPEGDLVWERVFADMIKGSPDGTVLD